jgi:hypothetical protein
MGTAIWWPKGYGTDQMLIIVSLISVHGGKTGLFVDELLLSQNWADAINIHQRHNQQFPSGLTLPDRQICKYTHQEGPSIFERNPQVGKCQGKKNPKTRR